jgi:predicted DNA repair protein MutK
VAQGLIALLDDVVVLARAAAASMDDVAATSLQVGAKAAGVVVDDAAVTPGYVHGFPPARELPVVGRIAVGSLRNKVLVLLPAALLLSSTMPAAVPLLLLAGGAYLCFEGAEKVVERLAGHHEAASIAEAVADVAALEEERVRGAIRTDFVLSGEIMAIALADVTDAPLVERAAVLLFVAVGITGLVYGTVAVLVKADDVGLHWAREGTHPLTRAVGRQLLAAMPRVMEALAHVGAAAMLWVGGHIVVEGVHDLGVSAPHAVVDAAQHAVEGLGGPLGGLFAWVLGAALHGVIGLLIGGMVVAGLHRARRAAVR